MGGATKRSLSAACVQAARVGWPVPACVQPYAAVVLSSNLLNSIEIGGDVMPRINFTRQEFLVVKQRDELHHKTTEKIAICRTLITCRQHVSGAGRKTSERERIGERSFENRGVGAQQGFRKRSDERNPIDKLMERGAKI
jgi:hypothetical protein